MKTRKIISLLLALLMFCTVVPFYASAATVKLDKSNTKIIPPTHSKNDINYGEALSTVEIIGGTVYYIQPETGDLLEVPGHFEWQNPSLAPISSVHNGFRVNTRLFYCGTTRFRGTHRNL